MPIEPLAMMLQSIQSSSVAPKPSAVRCALCACTRTNAPQDFISIGAGIFVLERERLHRAFVALRHNAGLAHIQRRDLTLLPYGKLLRAHFSVWRTHAAILVARAQGRRRSVQRQRMAARWHLQRTRGSVLATWLAWAEVHRRPPSLRELAARDGRAALRRWSGRTQARLALAVQADEHFRLGGGSAALAAWRAVAGWAKRVKLGQHWPTARVLL